jgi:GNAT superfamily N-acetyltransferase
VGTPAYIRTANGNGNGEEKADGKQMPMIGLARLVTDYTTFGYLTDVYVLASHQGKGLGKWMMQCLDEVLESWPHLRRCLLFTRGEAAIKMYRTTIGAKHISETPSKDLVLLERRGPAVPVTGGKGTGVDGSKGDTAGER